MTSVLTLQETARALVVAGKGILAADESLGTIGKRFSVLGISSTPETRRTYRELLVTTPHLTESISGVILFDETLRQKASGTSVPEFLIQHGMLPGIKVDLGTVPLPLFPGEKFTQGLDGLRERLIEYRKLGARFTKWRAVIAVGKGLPTTTGIASNAEALALFAALSQEADLVPLVEPEVLMDGDHTLERCEEVTGQVLESVFAALSNHRVRIDAMLLKTGMVVPGNRFAESTPLNAVAEATLRCLRRTVPANLPGVVFLSGGQTDVVATERLNAICTAGTTPWTLSFSFGRALQDECLKTWNGRPANSVAAQTALITRARCNSAAVQGNYRSEMERTVHAQPAAHP